MACVVLSSKRLAASSTFGSSSISPAVAGNTYTSDQPLLFGFDRRLDHATRAERDVPLDGVGQVVELPQVDMVHAHAIKRAVQFLSCIGCFSLARLGGKEEMLAIAA